MNELLDSQKENKELKIKLAASENKADVLMDSGANATLVVPTLQKINATLRLELSKAENETAINENKVQYLRDAGQSTDKAFIQLERENKELREKIQYLHNRRRQVEKLNEELREKNGHTKDYLSTVEVALARAKDNNQDAVAAISTQRNINKTMNDKISEQRIRLATANRVLHRRWFKRFKRFINSV